ncbi:MAG: RidA family protein [Pseudonocardiaceae bacterium]
MEPASRREHDGGCSSTGGRPGDGVGEQIRQAMKNIQAVLEEAGSSFSDVVMIHAYLTEEGHVRELNSVLGEFVSKPLPARTTVYVKLPPGMIVEVDALAVVE